MPLTPASRLPVVHHGWIFRSEDVRGHGSNVIMNALLPLTVRKARCGHSAVGLPFDLCRNLQRWGFLAVYKVTHVALGNPDRLRQLVLANPGLLNVSRKLCHATQVRTKRTAWQGVVRYKRLAFARRVCEKKP